MSPKPDYTQGEVVEVHTPFCKPFYGKVQWVQEDCMSVETGRDYGKPRYVIFGKGGTWELTCIRKRRHHVQSNPDR